MARAMRTLIAAAFALLLAPVSTSQEVVIEAANWKEQAAANLLRNGSPVSGDIQTAPLCVRLNNYGCVKQGGSPWSGSNGLRDSKGHAVFEDPAYSVRAVVRDYCSKHRQGVRDVLALAERYSPWCDTLGSRAVVNGWARSCTDNPKPPADFTGPSCKKPDGVPTAEQCGACNCPNQLAVEWLKGLPPEIAASGELTLFDGDGKPNVETFVVLLRNKMRRELGSGLEPTEEVLRKGIGLAGLCK